jgi:hypothetical protein
VILMATPTLVEATSLRFWRCSVCPASNQAFAQLIHVFRAGCLRTPRASHFADRFNRTTHALRGDSLLASCRTWIDRSHCCSSRFCR